MNILLIEDDEKLCELLRFQLEREMHQVDICHDGLDGLDLFLQDAYDLVLLDRMLPTMNGLLVLKKARNAGLDTPVILITALGELYDRVEGLDGGADDYLVKPFEYEELSARIRSLGRRSGKWEEDSLLQYGDISYDCTLRILHGPKGEQQLSGKEGLLLEVFMRDALGREVIREARDDHQMDIFHANVQQVIAHVEFDFASAVGEKYAASVGVVPRKGRHMGFAILYSLEKRQKEMSRLRLIFFLAGMAAIVLLLIFSWFFTKRMIIPLERSRKRQMQFIASASHELRAPLSVVRAGLESLGKTDSPEERARFIAYMEEENSRMQNLVSDMLLLANADSDHLPLHMESCQPEELLLNIYEKFESIAAKKKISLSISLPEEIMPDCLCDRERILQAFSVLLDNALSYTPSGGKVHLSLAAEKNALRFSFSDTGRGIPEEERERIFDRFYRSDDAHADKSHFGLGLCIAKEILEGHQGTIRAGESEMGGSCFLVELPLFNLARFDAAK